MKRIAAHYGALAQMIASLSSGGLTILTACLTMLTACITMLMRCGGKESSII